jgi:hypothetical protein
VANTGVVVQNYTPAEPALYGLLSSAADVVDDATANWQRGISYEMPGCGGKVVLQAICQSTDAVVVFDNTGDPTWGDYFPFAVQTSFTCSTMGYTPEDIERLAKQQLDAAVQYAAEYELWTGALTQAVQADTSETDYPNFYLASDLSVDITPTAGTGVKSKYGLALLEEALGKCGNGGGRGTIHTPRAVASALNLKAKGDHLETNLGNYVIAGTGYTGAGPDGDEPTDGKRWIYATGGRIKVWRGPVVTTPDTPAQAVDRSVNTVTYTVDQVIGITPTSCCSYGVLVDLDLDYS